MLNNGTEFFNKGGLFMKGQAKGHLGHWLAERCQEEGLSLRQAGEKTGLSHVTIADIIKGAQPTPESIKKLAGAFGGDGHRGLVIEDQLLVLAGYRTPRPAGEETSEPLAQLLDKLSEFSEPQLKLLGHFADFISETERK